MKSVLLIFIIPLQFLFSQDEKKIDHDLYTLILKEEFKFGLNKEADSIFIIKEESTIKTKFDWWMIDRDSVLSARINKNIELKNTIKSLTQCFDFHNNIDNGFFILDSILTNIHVTASSSNDEIVVRNKLKEENRTGFFLRISKPNYDGNLATIIYSYYCGGTCAGSDIIFFENKNDNWNILTKINLWIA